MRTKHFGYYWASNGTKVRGSWWMISKSDRPISYERNNRSTNNIKCCTARPTCTKKFQEKWSTPISKFSLSLRRQTSFNQRSGNPVIERGKVEIFVLYNNDATTKFGLFNHLGCFFFRFGLLFFFWVYCLSFSSSSSWSFFSRSSSSSNVSSSSSSSGSANAKLESSATSILNHLSSYR